MDGVLLGVIISLATLSLAMLGVILRIRREDIESIDRRIEERAEAIVAQKLVEPLRELQHVTELLSNGIQSQVKANNSTLREQDEKLDEMAQGLAEIKGAVRALSDAVLGRRPGGRRSTDPE